MTGACVKAPAAQPRMGECGGGWSSSKALPTSWRQRSKGAPAAGRRTAAATLGAQQTVLSLQAPLFQGHRRHEPGVETPGVHYKRACRKGWLI